MGREGGRRSGRGDGGRWEGGREGGGEGEGGGGNETKFSLAISLFLLQVLGHFTKAGQTRMSLVPEPQVNSTLFHMINPDNCVLIVSEVDGIPASAQTNSSAENGTGGAWCL